MAENSIFAPKFSRVEPLVFVSGLYLPCPVLPCLALAGWPIRHGEGACNGAKIFPPRGFSRGEDIFLGGGAWPGASDPPPPFD